MFRLHTIHWISLPISILVLCLMLFPGCAPRTVLVTGSVWRVSGNQMPSPDLPSPSYGGYPTRVYFYQPALAREASQQGPAGCYARIGTPLVASVATNKQGDFRLRLAPGLYSVLIGRDSLFYTNIFDGEGLLNPVEVKSGNKMRILLKADWGAQY